MTDPTAAAAPVAAPAPAAAPDPVASTLAPAPDPTPVATPTAAPAPAASTDPAAPATPAAAPAAAAPTPPATFPDDWRQRLAGTDEKTLKMLERLQSPEAMAKKLREQEVLISSGQIKKPLAANATPEQIAAYRTDNGIPDAPEKYFENLPDGLVIGAEDKPIFDDFAKTLHEKNIPPAAAHAAIEWYNKWQENNQALVAEVDRGNAQKTEDTLRQEWGADYRANANLRAAFLDTAPALVKDAFLRARLPDGSLLGEHADMSRWLVSMAREINPVASIPPSSGIGSGKSIEDRLGEIKPMMGNKNSEYWKGERGPDGKTSLEREYGQLLEVQLANKNRGG